MVGPELTTTGGPSIYKYQVLYYYYYIIILKNNIFTKRLQFQTSRCTIEFKLEKSAYHQYAKQKRFQVWSSLLRWWLEIWWLMDEDLGAQTLYFVPWILNHLFCTTYYFGPRFLYYAFCTIYFEPLILYYGFCTPYFVPYILYHAFCTIYFDP